MAEGSGVTAGTTENSKPVYNCSGIRTYPDPQHASGLPFLADVFAANRSVYFVAVNKGACYNEWRGAHEFHFSDNPPRAFRFLCVFPDGGITVTDVVNRKRPGDFAFTNQAMIIRCDIPVHYQSLVAKPSPTTTLTVSLHAMTHLEAPPGVRLTMGNPWNSLRDIPVCNSDLPPYPALDDPPRYKISLVTRIKMTYAWNNAKGDDESVYRKITTTPQMVLAWVLWHRSLGVDHFYIYDNDEVEHGPLENVLRDFIAEGLVTYIWFPFKDCLREFDACAGHKPGHPLCGIGLQVRAGQLVALNGGIRRFAHRTEYMGHWDVDEYLVPKPDWHTIPELLERQGAARVDTLMFTELLFSVCDGDRVTPGALPFERAHCFTRDINPPKSIHRTDRILWTSDHGPWATLENGHPVARNVPIPEGFLAHYQRRPNLDYDADKFEGVARSRFVTRHDAMGALKETIAAQVEEHMKRLYGEERLAAGK
eukprot:jgi/Mesvir1/12367/Mv00550-RA.1